MFRLQTQQHAYINSFFLSTEITVWSTQGPKTIANGICIDHVVFAIKEGPTYVLQIPIGEGQPWIWQIKYPSQWIIWRQVVSCEDADSRCQLSASFSRSNATMEPGFWVAKSHCQILATTSSKSDSTRLDSTRALAFWKITISTLGLFHPSIRSRNIPWFLVHGSLFLFVCVCLSSKCHLFSRLKSNPAFCMIEYVKDVPVWKCERLG